MSTTIEWTQRPGTKGETWNPVVGCTKVSAGCKHCYAKTLHDLRHKAYKAGKLQNIAQYAEPFEKVQLMHERLTLPLKWKQPRTVFVNSVSDLFHEEVPFDYIDQVFAVMALTPQHTYQILTKRPERMAEYLNDLMAVHRIASHLIRMRKGPMQSAGSWPQDNVWLGTSVEDQATANARIPHLLRCPAAVRFLSCEPLLGAVDLRLLTADQIMPPGPGNKFLYWRLEELHWVITGGESGHKARPMHPDWARGLRDQCKAAGVSYFFKQWGTYRPLTLDELGMGSHTVQVAKDPAGKPSFGYHMPHQLEAMITSPDHWQFPMLRVGKKEAGHLLDGVEHHEWPQVGEMVVAE